MNGEFYMQFRELNETKMLPTMELAEKVFMEYEAPEDSRRGIAEFIKVFAIHSLSLLRCDGAWNGKALVGTIATRECACHIALFFVDGIYHRQGIGKRLFQLVVKANAATGDITVIHPPSPFRYIEVSDSRMPIQRWKMAFGLRQWSIASNRKLT